MDGLTDSDLTHKCFSLMYSIYKQIFFSMGLRLALLAAASPHNSPGVASIQLARFS